MIPWVNKQHKIFEADPFQPVTTNLKREECSNICHGNRFVDKDMSTHCSRDLLTLENLIDLTLIVIDLKNFETHLNTVD